MNRTNDYLIDVPVYVVIWTREEFQKKQWDIIKKAKPSILFLQSDGGRNERESESISRNRRMIDESIDWNCSVYRFYEETNIGMYKMFEKVSSKIWEIVDRCIFLEDDILPTISFFRFCADLLEKYKDDQRVECICGFNHLGVSEKVNSDYFFSRQGSIWGIATWKRVFIERTSFSYYEDSYVMEKLKERTKNNKIAWKRLKAYGKGKYFEGHSAGTEFWIEFNMYSQNRLQIIPKFNLIKNLGNTFTSEHSCDPKYQHPSMRKLYELKTFEIDFPLKDATYVIPDIEYEKKRNWIMAYNHPFLDLRNKIHKLLIALINLNFSYVKSKIIKKSKSGKKEIEK